MKPAGTVPTVIANHSGGLDIINLVFTEWGKVSFIAKAGLAEVPVIGFLI